MKVVIVHKHSRYTGVSSFVYTIAKHLCREMGHEVHVVIPDQSNKRYCQLLKTAVKGNLRTSYSGPADVFIFNYASDVSAYKNWSGKKVFVVHGLMEPEYVPPMKSIDKVICMSKRAFNHIDAPVKLLINQPIDLDRFNVRKPINDELQKVLMLDARNNNFYTSKIQSACAELGIYCQTLGKNIFGDNSRFDVETVINTSDLVIGYGRSIYEALACG
jgi:glycosyltransferase involved in cell wall biosynthesis